MSLTDDEDLAARKYAAAHDPAFPARREAAFAAILAALEEALVREGYALKGSTFSRTTPNGKSAVHLQRSRYGWDAQIVLRFVTADGNPPDHPDWPEDDDLTLWHFAEDHPRDPGKLAFVDVLDDPAALTHALDLLTTRALPWLDALHDH
ncbi:MAG: hypothetical protein NTW20_05740 [Rhodobacterales bacterium]|nr:hypothetical protein [Rhodobacterales bacterium]